MPPTIKTTGTGTSLRILTKTEGGVKRVSCSCCEGESCCVYPAECGLGPSSISFFGEILAGSGGIYGNTENGVILEGGVWAVYRNSFRTEIDCIGMATSGAIPIAAILPSALFLSFDFPSISATFTATLNFSGSINPALITESDLFGQTGGQCFWNGAIDQVSQDFDEGLALLLNPATCRWELADGPLGAIFAHREDASPVGAYIANDPLFQNFVIS